MCGYVSPTLKRKFLFRHGIDLNQGIPKLEINGPTVPMPCS